MYKLLKLNLARNSLRYIIRTYNISEIYIPYYLCNVIRHSIFKEKCKINFYHIDNDFMPADEFPINAFILYPNYFGVCDNNVEILSKKYRHLIVDNSHSFYSKPQGFACFNSARKFLSVYYGSYLWIKDIDFIPETETDLITYKNIEQKERSFDQLEIKTISKNIIEEIEKGNFKTKRKKNFETLHQKFGTKNQLKIQSAESPFCYPYLAQTEEEADKLVKHLNQQGKIIYRYWNELPQNYNEYKFYKQLVAIPL